MSYIKKYFGKDTLNEKNIDKFINRKIEESINLDYKDIQKYNDHIDLGAKISSLANTDGGLLILGISEEEIKEKGRTVRIFPKEATWGDPKKYLKDTLENRLFGVIKPWISKLKIIPVRHSETKEVIFLIDIPKSNDRPHMVNNKFYYRINFSSIPMEYDHVKSMFLETYIYKQDLLEKYFSPIYSDIDIIIENIVYEYENDIKTYNILDSEYRLLLSKFNDIKLKNNIDAFYKIIKERNYCIRIYEEIGKNIINRNIETFLKNKCLKPPNQDTTFLEVEIDIAYKNTKKSKGRLHLPVDILYKNLGYSVKRSTSVESISNFRYLVHKEGGAALELQENEFNKLWEQILTDSNQDSTFIFLRDSVKEIKDLGSMIKKKIEEL